MIAVIFGIQGVGKTSVVDGVMSEFTGDRSFRLLQWGEKTYEIALQKNIIRIGDYKTQDNLEVIYEDGLNGVSIVKNQNKEQFIYVTEENNLKNSKDEIRNLNLETQKLLQKEVSDSFATEILASPNKNYLIETHSALKTLQGYLPGLTFNFMKQTKPDIYIIIEANADEIFIRRLFDKARKREHDKTTKDVQTNLDTSRYFASSYATYTHSPLVIVENKDKLVKDTVENIVKILERFEK